MSKLLGLLVCTTVIVGGVATTQAAPIISFDDAAIDGGTISYNGSGGALVGIDIAIDTLRGIDTPLNSGVYACTSCFLNFTTGTNTSEGPPVWLFGGGGVFEITGTVAAAGASGTLLTGTWTGAAAIGFGGVPGTFDIQFGGSGIDTKNPDLLTFFGISPTTPFSFAQTEISGGASVGSDGSISGTVHEVDVINTAVPEPTTLGLLGAGLFGVGALLRRRRSARL